MEELCQVKSALLSRIQVASVGVMREDGDMVLANADIITRVDTFLREQLGDGKGLKIAGLIKGRRPSSITHTLHSANMANSLGEGNVSFTLRDLASLDAEVDDADSEDEILVGSDLGTSSTGSRNKKASLTRIIIGNAPKEQAVMIKTPIGKDIWTHISHLEIKDSRAEGDSSMINNAMTPEYFFRLMQLQKN
ncbi:hypothetical protein E6O75_ATG11518 [Venturia nashicola]|uniref:Uncharacterized protein n=1 Tax=Venturia nashicola TaxID=86259 RepID=A0A4Z1NL57_9PEZI|nr:hypothetical protein E6O75_ATG11518 [Venturia nashicola]